MTEHWQNTNSTSDLDQRDGKKRKKYDGEAVLRWSHDFSTPIRYTVVDRSEGGLRIVSHLPLNEGMTGLITRYLPEGAVGQSACYGCMGEFDSR